MTTVLTVKSITSRPFHTRVPAGAFILCYRDPRETLMGCYFRRSTVFIIAIIDCVNYKLHVAR